MTAHYTTVHWQICSLGWTQLVYWLFSGCWFKQA